MQIGFDARAAFLDPFRGFGRVSRSLAGALIGEFPGEVVVFVPHGVSVPERWYAGAAEVVHLRRPRRGAFLFDGPAWRATLRRHPVDVLHLPTWGVPPAMPVPVVATFYDATPFRFASPPAWWPRVRARRAIASLARATMIHAISEFARAECLATVRVPPGHVATVHLGVDPAFTPPVHATPGRHLLFVGGTDPHKNVELLAALFALPGSESLPPLLVAGGTATVPPVLRGPALAGRVVAVAAHADEELAALYRDALALLIPSRSEGFGLPAIEAMACGCPVLAARAGSLPEVCGEAAIVLDPDEPGQWLASLRALVDEPARRRALSLRGPARAASFRWSATARGLAPLYRAATRAPSARS